MVDHCAREAWHRAGAAHREHISRSRRVIKNADSRHEMSGVGEVHIVDSDSDAGLGDRIILPLKRDRRVNDDIGLVGSKGSGHIYDTVSTVPRVSVARI